MGEPGPSNADFHEGAEEKASWTTPTSTARPRCSSTARRGAVDERGGLLGRLLLARRQKYERRCATAGGRGLKG